MFVLVEIAQYVDGNRTVQICGTYNDLADARYAMRSIFEDERKSDECYDPEWERLEDSCASLGGPDGFPRLMDWFIFDTMQDDMFCF